MGIFEISGGEFGLGEYLENGQKIGRNYSREELDERVFLYGDLAMFEAIVDSMDRKPGTERYMHISNSFKECYIPVETLHLIDKECREFFGSAYKDGELCIYTEAHYPKINYIAMNGEVINRLLHFHTGIPTVNLLTGERANPLEMLKVRYGDKHSTQEYVDAFQEYINEKYGLASPKDNPRLNGSQEARLARDKTAERSDFAKRTESVPTMIMQQVIEREIINYDDFKKLCAEFGDVSVGRQKGRPYLKIKQTGDAKSIRLNDPVFDRKFIERSADVKRAYFERSGEKKYLEPAPSSHSSIAQIARMKMIRDWHEIRAREIRYISPSSKFFKERYRHMTRDQKKIVLDKLERGEVYKDNEFEVAPTSTRLNRITATQIAEDLEMGRLIIQGDNDSIRAFLDALTHHQSSFAKSELESRLLEITDGSESYDKALEAVLRNENLVLVGEGAQERYTSRRIKDMEDRIVAITTKLKDEKGDDIAAPESLLETMNAGQKLAFKAMCSGDRIVVVNGAAGTGKSYVLARLREAAESAGYEIHGAILQGKTAQDLERDSGIKSGTLHSFISRVDSGKLKLHKKSIIVIDEAGMVGSEQMVKVMNYAKKYGCRVRLVGDVKQVQAVSFGDAFANISNIVGATELTQIRRQDVKWQRQASMLLAKHDMNGMNEYMVRGHVQILGDQLDAIDALAARVKADRHLQGASIVICKTNAERAELNAQIREDMIDDGLISGDKAYLTNTTGRRLELRMGDSIMFTAGHYESGARNGTMAKVKEIRGESIVLEIRNKEVVISQGAVVDADYGYAVTINKSQGMTIDRAYVLSHKGMTANDVYVAMTRHKGNVQMFASREHFSPKGVENPADVDVFEIMKRKFSQAGIKQFTGSEEEKSITGSVVEQLIKDHNMEAVIAKESQKANIKQLKSEIDLAQLLIRVENATGRDTELYQITDKNLIRAGSRELDAIQFMTQEMHMDYQTQAMPFLREAYREQLKGVYVEKQAPATAKERVEFASWVKVREAQYSADTKALTRAARAAKAQAREIGDLALIDKINDKLQFDRAALDMTFAKPNRELFNEFRKEKSVTPVAEVHQPPTKGNEYERDQQQYPTASIETDKQDIAGDRGEVPPQLRGRVRNMSEINVVTNARSGQMLLQRDVQLHVDDSRADGDQGMRWTEYEQAGRLSA